MMHRVFFVLFAFVCALAPIVYLFWPVAWLYPDPKEAMSERMIVFLIFAGLFFFGAQSITSLAQSDESFEEAVEEEVEARLKKLETMPKSSSSQTKS